MLNPIPEDEALAVNEKPIGLFKWFPDTADKKFLRWIPEHDGDVAFFSGVDGNYFLDCIRTWLYENENAQYLVALAHGIHEDGRTESIGIGADWVPGWYVT